MTVVARERRQAAAAKERGTRQEGKGRGNGKKMFFDGTNSAIYCKQRSWLSSFAQNELVFERKMRKKAQQMTKKLAFCSPSNRNLQVERPQQAGGSEGDYMRFGFGVFGKPSGPAVSEIVPVAGFLKKGFLILYERSQYVYENKRPLL